MPELISKVATAEKPFQMQEALKKNWLDLNNLKYQTMLGHDPRVGVRNEKTIKMSSGSAAINIYRNEENRAIMEETSLSDFSKK